VVVYTISVYGTTDCTALNIMLDSISMCPESFHPVEVNRSAKLSSKGQTVFTNTTTDKVSPYRLWTVSLVSSCQWATDKPYRGGDESAPEHQDRVTPCNPFPTDVYYLGNLVREEYMQV